MPRCKAESCKRKFIAKRFNQKTCSKKCQDEYEEEFEEKSLSEKAEKRKEQEKLYGQLRKVYLINNPRCEKCGKKKATEIHHKNGRNGNRLNDVDYFMAVDRDCHNYIHEHPKESRENDWLI